MRWIGFISFCFALPLPAAEAGAEAWSQFRGANASGVAAGGHQLPAEIGPNQNLLWKVPLPPGHSSPVVQGERIYVTGVREHKLVTIGLDRRTGNILWEAEAPHQGLEKIHQIGSHAQPSPAADGECVVTFFGSSGLACYSPDGKLLWHRPFGPFKNDFGAGSSPILAGDRVILNQDHDTDSALMALDKRTGATIWKADRSEFPRGYATPILWEVAGKKQIVVVGTLRVAGYDFETGHELWTVRGLARIANMTPTVGSDGILYVAAWAPGGDPNDRIDTPTFAELMKQQDSNGNNMLESNEVPPGPLKERFTQIDRDKDGHITRDEYEYMRRVFDLAQNVVLAVKPGGTGDVTESHVLWTYGKLLPYVPSPLYYNGYLFMVKNGGLVNCLDAKTGQPAKQERVPGSGNYYSSPVAGDGKIYLLSERGDLSVISAEPNWRVLAKAKFGEDAYATPAIAGGCIYLRTAKHLYCFGFNE